MLTSGEQAHHQLKSTPPTEKPQLTLFDESFAEDPDD